MPRKYDHVHVISDRRGAVFEPLITADFPQQKNAHVVMSLPGVVRGNHYHMTGEETVAVMGPALVRIRENDQIEDIDIPDGKAFRFTFLPGVSHAIKNVGDHPNVLVAFNTIEHDPENPDTVGDVLI